MSSITGICDFCQATGVKIFQHIPTCGMKESELKQNELYDNICEKCEDSYIKERAQNTCNYRPPFKGNKRDPCLWLKYYK